MDDRASKLREKAKRHERRAAGAILAVEATTLRDARERVKTQNAALVGELDGVTEQHTAYQRVDHRREQVAAAVLWSLLSGQAAARAAARSTLARTLGVPVLAVVGTHVLGDRGDRAHAASAAHSYASAWGATMLASVALSKLSGARIASEVKKAGPTTLPRLGRTVATELVRAHTSEAEHVTEHDPNATDFGRFRPYKVWSSILDRRTCPFCADLDGETRSPGDSFPVNPPVHPLCRCQILYFRV